MTAATRPANAVTVYACLALVQVLFGLHYLAAKLLLEEIPPRAWALIRVAAAAAVLLLASRLLGRRLPRSGPLLGRLALYSVLGVVINQLCFVEGLSRTTPSHSAIIMTTTPVGTLMFAVLLRRETLHLQKLLSLAVGFAGVLLVVRPAAGGGSDGMFLGDLLTLVNALSYSLFLVLSKRLMGRVDALAATATLLGFGTVGMLVPGLPALLSFDPSAVSAKAWALGLFIVLFPTAAAYLLIYWALARVESSVVGLFIYLQPVIATALSFLLLGERPQPVILLGAALIFVAAYLAVRPRIDARKTPPAGSTRIGPEATSAPLAKGAAAPPPAGRRGATADPPPRVRG